MEKLLHVPLSATADSFGCSATYFRQHVRGKLLQVVSETKSHITVIDREGEEHTVNKNDLPTVKDPS